MAEPKANSPSTKQPSVNLQWSQTCIGIRKQRQIDPPTTDSKSQSHTTTVCQGISLIVVKNPEAFHRAKNHLEPVDGIRIIYYTVDEEQSKTTQHQSSTEEIRPSVIQRILASNITAEDVTNHLKRQALFLESFGKRYMEDWMKLHTATQFANASRSVAAQIWQSVTNLMRGKD